MNDIYLPPPECRWASEDLECLGCGAKLWHLNGSRPGFCFNVEAQKAEQARKEAAERELYQKLRAKYEGEVSA